MRHGADALLMAAQLALLYWTRVGQSTAYIDDAYIHFRNAKNWAEGLGLVYNPGQWIIGTTSPIHGLLLGGWYGLTGTELPRIAVAYGFVTDAVLALLTLLFLRRAGVALVFRHAIVASLSVEPLRMYYSSAGMELSLFLVATIAICICLNRGRWVAAGLLLGPIGWIRPEGAIVWVAAAGALALTGRRRPLVRVFAVAGLVALLFVLALLATYGTIIPQSILAKARAPWFGSPPGRAAKDFFMVLGSISPLRYFSTFNLTNGFLMDEIGAREVFLSALASLFQCAFIALGWIGLRRRGQTNSAWFWLIFFVGYYLFYAVTNPQIFLWYYVPFHFAALLLAGIGWWWTLDWTVRRFGPPGQEHGWFARSVVAVGGIYFLAFSVSVSLNRAIDTGEFDRYEGVFRYRELEPDEWAPMYERAARVLNRWTAAHPSRRVALAEIGILGYGLRCPVLDSYGLVSPEALKVLDPEIAEKLDPISRAEHPLNVYLALRPEYILTMPHYLSVRTPAFEEAYTRIRIPQTPKLWFFVRNDCLDAAIGDEPNAGGEKSHENEKIGP